MISQLSAIPVIAVTGLLVVVATARAADDHPSDGKPPATTEHGAQETPPAPSFELEWQRRQGDVRLRIPITPPPNSEPDMNAPAAPDTPETPGAPEHP